MSKATPGPWTFEHHGGPFHLFGGNDARVGTYSPVYPAHTEEQFSEWLANARLIAAAPELLEALQAASEWRWETATGKSHIMRKIRAAIAKATGEAVE